MMEEKLEDLAQVIVEQTEKLLKVCMEWDK